MKYSLCLKMNPFSRGSLKWPNGMTAILDEGRLRHMQSQLAISQGESSSQTTDMIISLNFLVPENFTSRYQ